MASQKRIILDTDPGIDDILAIFLAQGSPEVELLGVTTAAGNVKVDEGTHNAVAALNIFPSDRVPVCMGCWRPLVRELHTQAYFYGSDEQIGIPWNANWKDKIDSRHAVNFLIEQVRKYPGEVTLFPLAPLTNIASAIILDPTFATNVKEIFLMGGAALVPGNATPTTEFNIVVDPEAASVVFNSGIPITMIGLDVTGKTALWPEDVTLLDSIGSPVTNFIRLITRHYLDTPKPCYLYDPLAVAVGLNPALVKRQQKCRVDVETHGDFTAGTTFVDLRGFSRRSPNVNVCLEVDSEAFRAFFLERVINRK